MPNHYRQSDISSITNKNVFFDANILIYLFWPTTSNTNSPANQYSSVLASLLQNGFKLFVNPTVVSEAINRILRIEFENYKIQNGNDAITFKTYRDSIEGRQAQSDAYAVFNNRILNLFSIKDKCLSKNDIKSFLFVNSLDFNDKIILDICKSNNLILLTHDKDYVETDIDVISANRAYFTAP